MDSSDPTAAIAWFHTYVLVWLGILFACAVGMIAGGIRAEIAAHRKVVE
jgi:hypothetical protein